MLAVFQVIPIHRGGNNTFLGYASGYSNTTQGYNTCLGNYSGYYNQSGALNTIVGDEAAYGVSGNSNSYNSIFGYKAGYGVTTGSNNVFMGYETGYANTTGGSNVFMGVTAAKANTTGLFNIAIGGLSLITNTSGNSNTAVGYQALYLNTIGTNNIGVGENSGYSTTSGTYNTFVGEAAGGSNTTGSYNTCIGNGADVGAGTYSNASAIGNGTVVSASNKILVGNASVTAIQGVVNFSSTSDGRFKTNISENVKGLEFINKLRPVTYNMNTQALDNFIIQNMPDSIKAKHRQGLNFAPSMAIVHSGFIAQEVEAAAQQVGFTSSIVNAPANSSDPYSLSYSELVVPLVKAVQELSKKTDSLKTKSTNQDSINAANKTVQNAQQMQIGAQAAMLQAMQNRINQLDSIINACCSNSPQHKSHSSTNANSTNVDLSNIQAVVLSQNSPNPFNEQTTISCFLTDDVGKAEMLFYDANGTLIKTVELTQRGQGQLNVFAQDLTNGMYTYTLVVDGNIFATKKMVKQ